jgi:putative mRNA 3-end processing factor
VSFHPAGHILGSAQVRVECRGEVWVFSGDYKLTPDATCEPFEPVRCDVFITESTFGLPIYRWPDPDRVMRDITEWWRGNAAAGRTSVLYAYPLGKTQRILGGLAEFGELPGPLAVHGGGARMTELYRAAGRRLADAHPATSEAVKSLRGSGLLICSPIAEGTGPLRRLGETSTAFASGWMRIRGVRRRRALDRGFCISDHADWPGLLTAIRECGASRIAVTHGYTAQLVRHLREKGVDAWEFPTRYSGEPSELDASAATSDAREASRAKRPHQPDSDAPPPPGAPQGELPL